MATPEQPQTYLITPPSFELSRFPDRLAAVLDRHDIACVRLAMATQDAADLSRAASSELKYMSRVPHLPASFFSHSFLWQACHVR